MYGPNKIYEQLHVFTLMKRRCGVKQGLRKCWFHLQNEMKTRWGDSKIEIGFDVHHIYEHIDVKDWKTRPIMVEKCQNLRNEMKTRLWDSVNLFYWGHRTNKSRRSYTSKLKPRTKKLVVFSSKTNWKSLCFLKSVCGWWYLFAQILFLFNETSLASWSNLHCDWT